MISWGSATYRVTPVRLILTLLLWMLCTAAGCALVYLSDVQPPLDARPIRTRPPQEQGR